MTKKYSDDRMSLAQEIYEGLKQRGYWVPKHREMAGPDLITAIFLAVGEKPMSTETHHNYDHDCDSCESLGSYTYDAPMVEGTEEMTVDLWYCKASIGGPTLIARFSSDGPDYSSAPVEIVERSYLPRAKRGEKQSTAGPAIVEAYRRLKKKESQ